MHELLQRAIDTQGGIDAWRKFNTATAHTTVGGTLWERKGHAGEIDEVDVTVDLLEQKVSHDPGKGWHTLYTPHRVAIETDNGDLVEELYNPRASYQFHTWDTQWDNMQLAYFSGYATWNYFNTPFQFTRPGFVVSEMEQWEENAETWRRLLVRWPKGVHTHSSEQVLYIDKEGYIRRLDYRVEVAGNSPAAHYLSNYKGVSGIKMATTRRVYRIGEDNIPQLDTPAIVTIDWTNIKYT